MSLSNEYTSIEKKNHNLREHGIHVPAPPFTCSSTSPEVSQ